MRVTVGDMTAEMETLHILPGQDGGMTLSLRHENAGVRWDIDFTTTEAIQFFTALREVFAIKDVYETVSKDQTLEDLEVRGHA